MPNQLSFEVEITRKNVELLISNPNVDVVVVSGTYTYKPECGKGMWEMEAFAQAVGSGEHEDFGINVPVCPKPCRTE